jgi:hypothetical protein
MSHRAEPKDEAERKWRSGFKLKSTSPAPFLPAYPGRYLFDETAGLSE